MLNLDDFVAGYIEAALWSTHDDESNPEGDGPMLDANYSVTDIDPDAMSAIREDCRKFIESIPDEKWETYCAERAYDPSKGSIDSYAGYDFLLDRNGHGTGFWDRDLGTLGNELSKATNAFGETYFYASNGRIYAD